MQLVMSLKGEALRNLSYLLTQIQHDYNALVEELTRRYNPTERETAWKLEFRNRERQVSESVLEYGHALGSEGLSKICSQCEGNLDYGTVSSWLG